MSFIYLFIFVKSTDRREGKKEVLFRFFVAKSHSRREDEMDERGTRSEQRASHHTHAKSSNSPEPLWLLAESPFDGQREFWRET